MSWQGENPTFFVLPKPQALILFETVKTQVKRNEEEIIKNNIYFAHMKETTVTFGVAIIKLKPGNRQRSQFQSCSADRKQNSLFSEREENVLTMDAVISGSLFFVVDLLCTVCQPETDEL